MTLEDLILQRVNDITTQANKRLEKARDLDRSWIYAMDEMSEETNRLFGEALALYRSVPGAVEELIKASLVVR